MDRKPKLEVLDALRGVCALAVMLLHLTELTPYKIVPHAHLPVAYFFLLTGFTFVYAYDGRWTGMSVGAFFRRRILRLQPLVVIGSVVGLVALCLMPSDFLAYGHGTKPSVAVAFLWSCLTLPAPASWGCLNVLQGQLWTLYYIYLANVLYALVLRRLKTGLLAALAVAALVLMILVGWHFGTLELGWMLKTDHVSVALARMAFPVLLGMVIARCGWRIPLGRFALPVTTAVLVALFAAPPVGSHIGEVVFDVVATAVVLPLVVLMAVGGRIGNERVAAACRFLGRFSFPLYATHFAFRRVMMQWFRANPGAPVQEAVLVMAGTGVVMLVFAWAAMKAVEAFASRTKRNNP